MIFLPVAVTSATRRHLIRLMPNTPSTRIAWKTPFPQLNRTLSRALVHWKRLRINANNTFPNNYIIVHSTNKNGFAYYQYTKPFLLILAETFYIFTPCCIVSEFINSLHHMVISTNSQFLLPCNIYLYPCLP